MFEFSENNLATYRVNWQVIDLDGNVHSGIESISDTNITRAEISVEEWLRSLWPKRRAMWVRADDDLTL